MTDCTAILRYGQVLDAPQLQDDFYLTHGHQAWANKPNWVILCV
jgi:hypothetical protein